MSINPSMTLICGVTNASKYPHGEVDECWRDQAIILPTLQEYDKNWSKKEYDNSVNLEKIFYYLTERIKEIDSTNIGDLLYSHFSETLNISDVIGLKIADIGYANPCYGALCYIEPNFLDDGYLALPAKPNSNYSYFSVYRSEFYRLAAEYLFIQIGYQISAKDCQLILCWEWK